MQIRRNRLIAINESRASAYTDLEIVRREVGEARRLFTRHGWPIIDVSRRSIEETAAAILKIYRSPEDGG